jgi:S-adenosylmethionine hydrolase
MARPVIALLSDFGTADHYVGTMKGVLLGICPEATLVDITHELPAHDVVGGALELAAAYRFFPEETVFLAVVDPGVGSGRPGIAAEAGGYRFVGPDNGLLALVFKGASPSLLVELTEKRYARTTISRTFEGRDRFGPAAAWLAAGVPLSELGTQIAAFTPLAVPTPEVRSDAIVGEVMRVDRFGNLETNIDRASIEQVIQDPRHRAVVEIGTHQIVGVRQTYSDVSSGQLTSLFSSADYLEIAASGASAARVLGVHRGAVVRVCRLA